jgi:predicted GNAT superfamily acetyltransferase
MSEKNISSSQADNLQLKQLYESAFPENERIPWTDLVRLIDEMQLVFTTYEENNQLVGFTIVYPSSKVNWFWYFAVKEELRGQGIAWD